MKRLQTLKDSAKGFFLVLSHPNNFEALSQKANLCNEPNTSSQMQQTQAHENAWCQCQSNPHHVAQCCTPNLVELIERAISPSFKMNLRDLPNKLNDLKTQNANQKECFSLSPWACFLLCSPLPNKDCAKQPSSPSSNTVSNAKTMIRLWNWKKPSDEHTHLANVPFSDKEHETGKLMVMANQLKNLTCSIEEAQGINQNSLHQNNKSVDPI